jgi:hypothetical protein
VLLSNDEVFYTIPADAIPMQAGEYLALKIINRGASPIILVTEGQSSVCYPEDEPDYPVPELAVVILLGVGLVSLAGYMGLRQAKARTRA